MTTNNLPLRPKSIKICSVEGCDAKHYAKSFCEIHYTRFSRNGYIGLKSQQPKPIKLCSIENCAIKIFSSGFCRNHYHELITKHKTQTKFCSVDNCRNDYFGQTYCLLHYRRWKKYGDPLFSQRDFINKQSVAERMFTKIEKGQNENDCWKWSGVVLSNGYGQITIGGKKYLAHRLSFEVHFKVAARDSVLHSCDNPSCTNPKHLRDGTQKENMTDKVSRNRQAKGETNGRAKLTEINVIEIKEAICGGEAHSVIAQRFGVTPTVISSIKRGKSWRYLL